MKFVKNIFDFLHNSYGQPGCLPLHLKYDSHVVALLALDFRFSLRLNFEKICSPTLSDSNFRAWTQPLSQTQAMVLSSRRIGIPIITTINFVVIISFNIFVLTNPGPLVRNCSTILVYIGVKAGLYIRCSFERKLVVNIHFIICIHSTL